MIISVEVLINLNSLVGYEQVYIQNLEMSVYKCITYYRVRVFEVL